MKAFLKTAVAAGVMAFAGSASAVDIIAVTHGQASDPFWSIVKNGISQAGEDQGVNVEYRAPETFDMTLMSQLIEGAVNQEPDGLIVSNPDPDALGPAIERAVAAGIPVISINSGVGAVQALGITLQVGQEETTAGRAAGNQPDQQLCRNPEG